MTITPIIGSVATGVSVISMVPQVVKCWITKSTRDISIHAFALTVTGCTLWFTYGILQRDAIIYVANFIVGCMAASIVIAKLKYH